jgi:hypothetical protein
MHPAARKSGPSYGRSKVCKRKSAIIMAAQADQKSCKKRCATSLGGTDPVEVCIGINTTATMMNIAPAISRAKTTEAGGITEAIFLMFILLLLAKYSVGRDLQLFNIIHLNILSVNILKTSKI